MLVSFVCEKCGTRTSKVCRKKSYYEGIVIMQCQGENKQGCMRWHLISDNLQWFTDNQFLIDELMTKYGSDPDRLREEVLKMVQQNFDTQKDNNDQ